MLSIHKINPMARAIGTMGAVAALVGATTFAALTSNTVALTPNNLTVATASLAIGTGVADAATCTSASTTAPGLSDTSFAPGDTTTKAFCLENNGSVPLTVSATLSTADPGALDGNAAAQATTLQVVCGPDVPSATTLNSSWTETFTTALAPTTSEACTASATLNSSFSGSGGNVIPEFDINFVGTQPGV